MKPHPHEFNAYYGKYISQVPDGDIVEYLEAQAESFKRFILAIPESKTHYKYGLDKWTVAQVLQHVIDAERVFAYRMLRIARGDKTPMPGFEQNDWAEVATASDRSLKSLADEFSTVRGATLSLLHTLRSDQLEAMGTASDNPVSARALAWIIGGHATHHQNVLKERYEA